jgi:hypothetical protein
MTEGFALIEMIEVHFKALACQVHLEKDASNAESEQIRIFGNDEVDLFALIKIGELCVCLIGRDNEPYAHLL